MIASSSGLDIEHAGDVLARNDQNMDRRLGIDVFKATT